MDGYSSHAPVLRALCAILDPQSVLEFGAGFGSTPLLLDTVPHVVSVELNLDWPRKVAELLTDSQKDRWVVITPASELFHASTTTQRYDFILVDGGRAMDRAPVAMVCMARQLAATLILHDTEERKSYGWERLMMPEGWTRWDSTKRIPWTTVLSCDSDLILKLKNLNP